MNDYEEKIEEKEDPSATRQYVADLENLSEQIERSLAEAHAVLGEVIETLRHHPLNGKPRRDCCADCVWHLERLEPTLKLAEAFLKAQQQNRLAWSWVEEKP